MLHLLLLILKILGIVVLVVLGLILFLILLLLFVPVRYMADGSWYGKPKGRARVTWLLHILSVTVSYEKELSVTIRIFGFPIRKRVSKETEEDMEDALVHAMEVGEEDADAEAEDLLPDDKEQEGQDREADQAVFKDEAPRETLDEANSGAETFDRAVPEEYTQGKNKTEVETPGRTASKAEIPGKAAPGAEIPGKDASEADISGKAAPGAEIPGKDASEADIPGKAAAEQKTADQTAPRRFFVSMVRKVRKTWNRILSKLKFLFRRVCDTLRNIKEKKEQIAEWIKDPVNQKTLKLIYRQLKKVIRHIFPRKGRARITFGLEDPYSMGQALTYFSVIYPMCHKHIELYPVFDETIIEGEGFLKGRVRAGVLIGAAVRVLLDKNFRSILRKLLR